MTFAEVVLWGTKIGTVALPVDSKECAEIS